MSKRWAYGFAVVGLVLLFAVLVILGIALSTLQDIEAKPAPEVAIGLDDLQLEASEDLVWLRKETVEASTAGGTTASASTGRDLNGRIYAIHLDYLSGITTTTDITFSQAEPSLTILTVSNSATDGWYYPTVQHHNSAGATVTSYVESLVADAVDIAVAQTTSGTQQMLTVTVYWGQ